MIGSFVLGGLVFLISDSIFSAAFDVLIKISESYQPHIPTDYTHIFDIHKKMIIKKFEDQEKLNLIIIS